MQSRKLKLTDDVIRVVRDICSVVFNISSDEQLEKGLGINHEQLEVVIKKIVNALPDNFFERVYLLDEIKNICAREFVFFQVQEKWNDPRYEEDLANFICIFTRDMEQRFDTYKNYKSKMKEE